MKIHVVCDSASNYREIDGVSGSIASLRIGTDEREFLDDKNIDIVEMTDYLAGVKIPSRSACPSVVEWMESFGDNDNIIVITLSGALSGSYNSACIAAEQYKDENPGKRVYVLDTFSIGPVQKLCVEFIKKMIADGEADGDDDATFDSICKKLYDYNNDNLHIGFSLKSMNNLANNGRINKAVAKVVTTLNIRIVGDFNEEGILNPSDKCRGEAKAMATMFANMKKAGYKGGAVIIDHCLAPETAQALCDNIHAEYPEVNIRVEDTTGICSFYAEKGGIIVGYEK